MKTFNKFYHWAMDVKLHMAIYFVAILAVKCLINLLLCIYTVDILMMLEMLLVVFALAAVEYFLLPNELTAVEKTIKKRTLAWALLFNAVIIIGSAAFHWFPGLPLWAYVLLIFFLELALFLMWYGVHFIQKLDTSLLNEGLQNFNEK